ncbi:hypothetical protein H0E87_027575 [Populus deltoides]|uniref:Pectinesterase inhibitor domain-containing protein n=1 Tax=Populus deltoides TaxID=3696 RepID=A0A8T2X185_POPDE|nr:hypothetical protein H0E87_027575 [Populus deltoides]
MVSRPSPPRLLHSISLLLLLLLSIFHASDAATALVDKVCKQTSSYPFCVRSLYSDSRTPEADEYTLAYISVGVAYNNATSTQHYISDQLRSIEVNGSSHHDQQQRLQMCSRGYQRAVSALAMAHNDLDSETFFELARLAAKASSGANDCKAAFKGIPSPTALAKGNQDLVESCKTKGYSAGDIAAEVGPKMKEIDSSAVIDERIGGSSSENSCQLHDENSQGTLPNNKAKGPSRAIQLEHSAAAKIDVKETHGRIRGRRQSSI